MVRGLYFSPHATRITLMELRMGDYILSLRTCNNEACVYAKRDHPDYLCIYCNGVTTIQTDWNQHVTCFACNGSGRAVDVIEPPVNIFPEEGS
jgi:hypothetical protein